MQESKRVYDVVIIGAGPSGLVCGRELKERGVEFVVLEKGDRPGFSFGKMHESLKLLTSTYFSELPGLKFPLKGNEYPTRADIVEYLANYAFKFNLPIQYKVEVGKVEKKEAGFVVQTNQGNFEAKAVVVATGIFSFPVVPDIPGLKDSKDVKVYHSAEYNNPSLIIGHKVLVVGNGNSAAEIAMDLYKAGKEVAISLRNPFVIVPVKFLGVNIFYFLRWIEMVARGIARIFRIHIRLLTNPIVGHRIQKLIDEKKIDDLPELKEWRGDNGVFSDEDFTISRKFDVVIFATGYKYSASFVNDLVRRDKYGSPLAPQGEAKDVNGLYFVGIPGMCGPDSGFIRGNIRDAQIVAKKVSRYTKRLQ